MPLAEAWLAVSLPVHAKATNRRISFGTWNTKPGFFNNVLFIFMSGSLIFMEQLSTQGLAGSDICWVSLPEKETSTTLFFSYLFRCIVCLLIFSNKYWRKSPLKSIIAWSCMCILLRQIGFPALFPTISVVWYVCLCPEIKKKKSTAAGC